MLSHHRLAVLAGLGFLLVVALPGPTALAKRVHQPPVNRAQAADDPALPPYPRAEDASADATPGADPSLGDTPAGEASDLALSLPPGRTPTGVAERLAGWVAASDDNGDLPFLIVDKLGARVFAFNAIGEFLGSAPALVGLARGDDSPAGIGEMKLSQISDDERTTPAGRFVASFGPSEGHGAMLWVDQADAIALHPVMSVNAGEHRLQRIKSSDPSAHRISYGCINVPKAFYGGVVTPALGGGPAIVYVLPDTKAVDEVFPAFAAFDGDVRDSEPQRQQFSAVDTAARVPDPRSPGLDPVDARDWRPSPER